MPNDFRPQVPPGPDGARGPSQPIGFQELRQAWEISTLREDLERLVQGTEGLRDRIEDAVELVRKRFASMTAEDLADSERMAPLLQFAVSTLLEIRDEARRIDTRTGPVADEDRPSWMAANEAPRLRPSQPAPSPSPPPPASPPPTARAPEPASPAPPVPPAAPAAPEFQEARREPAAPPPSPSPSRFTPTVYAAPPPPPKPEPEPAKPAPSGSWLSPLTGNGRKSDQRNGTAANPPNSVDWLSRSDR
ncbi:hypothetical protein [Azospirillum rugosum]|uniref:Uncharacterized protein n=1 Tax=Azospirillum rugosum TaxID=416170 RepID=A0ABS4SF01_9PROT|nr:hypothetical protein [Azospirillum rugosum]MBP2291153.1 hypothetical protein [Azospirillum rugosum]MDQ0524783.1 hypothetical protein [Azospirillum rugosum]